MATAKEKVEDLRILLYEIQQKVRDIHEEGVVLNFTISSEQKTVEVKSASQFEISCKATINQEL